MHISNTRKTTEQGSMSKQTVEKLPTFVILRTEGTKNLISLITKDPSFHSG
jgi:hypothetical protein